MNKILVVEDNVLMQLWLVAELTEEGFSVLSAASGRDALAMVKEIEPDLVVLDVNLPDMDGVEVFRRLRAFNPQLPVIAHTAYEEYRETFMDLGGTAYVVKSSDISELKREIADALRRQDMDCPVCC